MSRCMMSNHRRRAVTGVFVVLLLPVLFGFAAFAVDLGARAVVQSELQNAVDAAVLAGVEDLKGDPPDPDAAQAASLYILGRNITWNAASITANASVEFGGVVIDVMTGNVEFQPGGGWDAMRVSVSSEHSYFFAPLLGVYTTTVSSMASAGLMDRPPVAMWRLNESVGTIIGDEMGNHDGQLFGDVDLNFGGVIASDGAIRIAMGLDDAGFVEIPHSDDFLLDHGAISFWFRTQFKSATQGLFSKDSSGYDSGGHIDIEIVSERVRVRLQSTSNSYYLYSPIIGNNEWYHVVFSFGAGGMKLFVNGVQVDSRSYTGGLGTTSGGVGNYEPITLGVSQMGSGNLTSDGWYRPFHGRIDEVAIYNRGVTEAEVGWLYQAVLGGEVDVGAVVRDGLLRL